MLLRRSSRLIRSPLSALYSTAAEPKLNLEEFRTNETNPTKHTRDHIGKYYTIDEATKRRLFANGGLPKKYEMQCKTFTEACLMVRPQTLEVMEYIERTDFNRPAIRYVLYGEQGTGKSLTIAHLAHYGYQNGYCLVHVPYAPDYYKRPKECGPSTIHEGMIDIPLDSAAWLVHFKSQNTELLTKLGLTVSKTYEWSKREQTPAGAPILELIDHGINRAKYASDVIAALVDEIKLASTEGKVKTMVLIDGYNSFFYDKTRVFSDVKKKHPVAPEKVPITAPFRNITNYDWCNGLCVLSVDIIGMLGFERLSDFPRYLLGKEGFEHLDPFVPIQTQPYTDKELQSCLSYYVNRLWLQNNKPGFDSELKFLSNSNPFKLMELCKSL